MTLDVAQTTNKTNLSWAELANVTNTTWMHYVSINNTPLLYSYLTGQDGQITKTAGWLPVKKVEGSNPSQVKELDNKYLLHPNIRH